MPGCKVLGDVEGSIVDGESVAGLDVNGDSVVGLCVGEPVPG